ncbi:ubiquitin-conjugating enzyme E2 S [Cryptococcus deuterogattii 99/473]|uniref:E2 ubiquitin-conjugating enzyme n=2 Tax=Cryptococcus deuterogattii TaxID=1859096 RepID=A0A0D0VDG7_9TREE|nr:ubiquitin-conjugating enzyme E2 S [Cryptococcus deuterogattii R265]KIR24977.1 ubiquitin-conjugating enzyme E2 S [Cryptococcus deuterogattii LA55]KIR36122.1 ubiquitin-conjugating enzyme E2 S [Cryptococcus deuterogattii MMRL2647]KIR42920.1 ubiquitin-conjugating enzyme E2 S [Cryptococcus deuterogattii Ram5]KIR75555.1 ubiquitin-conjugating enzyme E2 S [Cryptococcus deuterogattii CA1014]KIR95495.1 ubiquitin-conjugating enzyme E2 S [Cryptococcus deuterogattii CBS 10090]KIS01991.1 ubiquitin-conju
MALTPQALRLLSRQVVALKSNPPEGVRIAVGEEDFTAIEGWVQGPSGTPYEGGYFRIRFAFGSDFPNVPPKCTMVTKIFHPNISKTGEICVDTLKKGWKKEYGVGHVLITIKCLLIFPNPESALDEEAGKQLLEDYEGYSKYARIMTGIHAIPKVPPPEFLVAKVSTSDECTPTETPRSPMNAALHRPIPLGNSSSQERSSTLSRSAQIVQDGSKDLKAFGSSGATCIGGIKTAPMSKVKRGAKRL